MMILKFYRILKSINKSIINILILIIQISTSHILPIILYHLLYFIIMFQINIDNSSINAFASSYHKLCKISKGFLTEKINLPPLNSYLFLTAKLNIKPLIQHIILRENQLVAPIFTFSAYSKLKSELKSIFKKYFHQKLKEVNQGNLIILKPGESINVRSDFFCLTPHQKCQLNSAAIAIISKDLKQEAESEQELFLKLQQKQVTWEYGFVQEGDLIIIGRDCIYGSFRNDSLETKHYVEMRWIQNEYSSSSSNSSS